MFKAMDYCIERKENVWKSDKMSKTEQTDNIIKMNYDMVYSECVRARAHLHRNVLHYNVICFVLVLPKL